MGRKMCSIGSVIKSNNALCLVVGIKYVEQANKYIKKYLVVTYPLGYIDSNSIRVLEESEFDVVELGYDSSDKSVFNQYYVGMMQHGDGMVPRQSNVGVGFIHILLPLG